MSSEDWKNEVKSRIAEFRDKKGKEQSTAAKPRPKPRFPNDGELPPEVEEDAAIAEDLVTDIEEETMHMEPSPADENVEPVEADKDDWDALIASEMNVDEEVVEEAILDEIENELEDEVFHLDPVQPVAEQNEASADMLEKLSQISQSKPSSKKQNLEPTLFDVDEPAVEPPVSVSEEIESAAESLRKSALDNLRSASSNVSMEEKINKYSIEDSLDTAVDSYIPLAEPDDVELSREQDPPPSREMVIDKRQNQTSLMRLGAGGIDLAIVVISTLLISWIASMIIQAGMMDVIMSAWLPLSGLMLLIHFIYYVLFTSVTGQTPGKRMLNLTLVGKKPGPIGLGLGIIRWLMVMVSILPFFLGFIFMFVNKEGKALHDVILGMSIQRTG